MNRPIFPSYFDETGTTLLVLIFIAMLLSGALAGSDRARRFLGRSIDRFDDIPDSELDPELETGIRKTLLGLPGVLVAVLAAFTFRTMLYVSLVLSNLAAAGGHSRWWGLFAALPFAAVFPLGIQWWTRRGLTRHLDRRFARPKP